MAYSSAEECSSKHLNESVHKVGKKQREPEDILPLSVEQHDAGPDSMEDLDEGMQGLNLQ